MKAARLTGVGEVHLVDEPDPTPGPGEALVRVSAVGLCGSDLHWFSQGGIGDALLSRPLVLGHEFGGTVEGGPLDGRRVAVDPAVPDNVCERCREGNSNLCPQIRFAGHGATDGGLREYLAWPAHLLHRVPDTFSDGAVALLEPLGVALHSFDLGHVRYGGAVAVVGCGPIGLMVIQVARSAGASSIVAVEPLAHRRAAATRCGADLALSPTEAKASGLQVDVSFEVAGTDDAIGTGMVLVRPGGRLVLAGIPDDDRTSFPAALARRKGLTIAVVRRMKDAYPRAISAVERGVIELDWLITSRFALAGTAEAFRVAAERDGLKTVVQIGTPWGVSTAKGGPT
ncbi:MAG TPA: alcohol dehydrogenase catalytic domain-containing protein [Acidimicrobiales bacterium]|nr:alcohol dehydrogenase catalytic domain-containing protein [Acidimicrobiales bacterium]